MSNYHITQEQANELISEVGIESMTPHGIVKIATPEALLELINLALDQVLGEPVAWAEKGRENNVIADLVKQTNKNDWVKLYTVALYAPKEQS